MYATIPDYYGFVEYTPVIPKFYWDVYSQEQRIKEICLQIDKLANYSSLLADEINKIEAVTPEELEAYKAEVNSKLQQLKNLIDSLQQSELIYNVQKGEFTDSVQSQRDMFKDVTTQGLTVAQLNELNLTVSDLANSGLNCRGLAVVGSYLKQAFEVNEIYLYN